MGSVVRAVVQPFLAGHGGNGLVDEVIVIDDGSRDDTAEQARERRGAGGSGPGGAGRQGRRPWRPRSARRRATSWSSSMPTWPTPTPAFVTGLLGPLLTTEHVALVKGFYTRPLHGDPTGGGRVTELMARPVLDLFFPELAGVRQPLAGETAAHRWVFEKLGFAGGYGVELGLLIDVAQSSAPTGWPRSTSASASTATGRSHELRPQARRRAARRPRAGPAVRVPRRA